MHHIYTQQLFNFQKIIFFLIPSPSSRPTTGLFVNVWLHIHRTADMENDGMSAILCNRSLWSHFWSSKIYMRPPWTLLNCIWRFSTLQRHYLTFGDISLRWRWNMWFSQNSFWGRINRLKSLTHSNLAEYTARPSGKVCARFPAWNWFQPNYPAEKTVFRESHVPTST